MTNSSSELMRLQKFLARCGVASRRTCENHILNGEVSINDERVTHLGAKVNPVCDVVRFKGSVIKLPVQNHTIMLNKPAGYLTTMKDTHDRPCVASLINSSNYPGLYPIGRLDEDTTGLLLFSTDGSLGNELLHPRYHIDKQYIVATSSPLDSADIEKLECGIMLEDGMTNPAKLRVLGKSESGKYASVLHFSDSRKTTPPLNLVAITINQGKKRQIKRMFASVGHPVIALHRSLFGALELGDLKPGEYRELSTEEISLLKRKVTNDYCN